MAIKTKENDMPTPFAPSVASRGIAIRQTRYASDLELDPLPANMSRNPTVVIDGVAVTNVPMAPFLARNYQRTTAEKGYFIDFEGVQRRVL